MKQPLGLYGQKMLTPFLGFVYSAFPFKPLN